MKIISGNKNPILKFHRFHSPLYFIRNYYDIFNIIRNFSKFGKMIIKFPYFVQLQTQSYCNGSCTICPYLHVNKKLKHGKMSWSIYKKIVDECAANPYIKNFCLMLQNEPFIDKRIFKFIKYFKNSDSKAITTVVTNGTLLESSTISKILDSNLDVLMISLNAYSKRTYKKISPSFDFERVMDNINHLLSQDLDYLNVMISYVITKYNKSEISKAINFWQSKGLKIRINELKNRCGNVENFEELRITPSFINKIESSLMKKLIGSCTIPFSSFFVLYNGDVILCCNDWSKNFILGNVKENSITEIFNSKHLNVIRVALIKNEYHEIPTCNLCLSSRY